jgi:predicted PurR-regulated permease PerM
MFLSTQIAGEAVQLYNTTISGQDKQNLLITVLKSAGQTSENFIPGTGAFFVELSGNLDGYIQQGLEWLISHLGLALSGVSSFLLSLFIFFISFYYLLRDGNRLKKAIIKLSPLEDKEDEIVFKRLENAINSVIKGSLLIAIIQGILTTIGFTIFGIPNSILWGTITVIAALIPGIGTTLVILPAVVYLFIIGNNLSAVGLILWGMLAVGLIDNILGPKLVGRNLEIHPLFILLSVLGGIAFFGPLGVFLGPLTMSSLFAVLSVYVDIVNPDSKHKNSEGVAID